MARAKKENKPNEIEVEIDFSEIELRFNDWGCIYVDCPGDKKNLFFLGPDSVFGIFVAA